VAVDDLLVKTKAPIGRSNTMIMATRTAGFIGGG